ncbi:Cof-type HAD-IIB family hydrolase [Lichenicoccus roseus]|nr:Cof-type HAD-IIB family hydrolase [Lichenicoccus roseus]
MSMLDDKTLQPGRTDPSSRIRLLVSDIDGTLVTRTKDLTRAALRAAGQLREAGIRLALVSSRPARGMDMFLAPLAIDTPRAGLNGGEILAPDGSLVAAMALDPEVAQIVVETLDEHGVDSWLFAEGRWLIRRPEGAYVAQEHRAVRLEPVVVDSFANHYHRIGKIMGSSADYHLLERVERHVQSLLGERVNAHRSQSYYLDVTHPDANKGNAALRLAGLLGVPADEMACIGDMGNDISMLQIAGVSIAMGNATEEVAAAAHFVTDTNEEDGWAHAMQRFVLPRGPASVQAGGAA